ncbi:DUF2304 domain-containing protein [Nocardioides campestrisoli]|uniref:DUF2304 domain-containing protein n=1 Tax=Nocardioides campestrisoli TaxID=2736757 RepID=UPI00163D711C|nr:DUF2304 domain-containing protein [Nocardioides campestrisoli]
MTAPHLLGLVGALVTLITLFELLRRRHLREKYAVTWSFVALATVVVAVWPATLDWFAELVGVAVPANLLFFLASMLLLVVSIQYSYELGRLEDRTRTLAEEVALLRLELADHRAASGAEVDPLAPRTGEDVPGQ